MFVLISIIHAFIVIVIPTLIDSEETLFLSYAVGRRAKALPFK